MMATHKTIVRNVSDGQISEKIQTIIPTATPIATTQKLDRKEQCITKR